MHTGRCGGHERDLLRERFNGSRGNRGSLHGEHLGSQGGRLRLHGGRANTQGGRLGSQGIVVGLHGKSHRRRFGGHLDSHGRSFG